MPGQTKRRSITKLLRIAYDLVTVWRCDLGALLRVNLPPRP